MGQFMEAEEVQSPLLLLFQKMQALDLESLGRYINPLPLSCIRMFILYQEQGGAVWQVEGPGAHRPA